MQKEMQDLCDSIALNLLLNKTCHTCIENKIFNSYGEVVSCEHFDENKRAYVLYYPVYKTCLNWRDKMTITEILEREG